MYWNVEFFFEEPYRFYTTEMETGDTVSREEYELYMTGDYIKGEDGRPLKKPEPESPIIESTPPIKEPVIDDYPGDFINLNPAEVLEAIVDLQNQLDALKEDKNGNS